MDTPKYTPISCNFHDHIEHNAVLRKVVLIRYKEGDTIHEVETRILDTKTEKEGEFVILEKDGLKIRMDYLVSIGDEELKDYC